MTKTLLYKDVNTNEIKTFAEIKNEYEIAHECEIDIECESIIDSFIYENLACIGGNLEIINNNDEVLKWCNDYAQHVEADRGMTQEEIDDSIRDIYEAIVNNNDEWLIKSTTENIEDDELMERLQNLLNR